VDLSLLDASFPSPPAPSPSPSFFSPSQAPPRSTAVSFGPSPVARLPTSTPEPRLLPGNTGRLASTTSSARRRLALLSARRHLPTPPPRLASYVTRRCLTFYLPRPRLLWLSPRLTVSCSRIHVFRIEESSTHLPGWPPGCRHLTEGASSTRSTLPPDEDARTSSPSQS
jgi:hypothetical protein